jgi:DNA-binding CsgD family transcriptional regulator
MVRPVQHLSGRRAEVIATVARVAGATPRWRGAVVEGAPAMGVSTTLREVAAALRDAGRPVRLVQLPDPREGVIAADPDEVLIVDDAHLAAGTLLYDLRDRALAGPVVLGVRSGAAPAALAALWSSGSLDHHELVPLHRDEVAALAASMVVRDLHRALVDDLVHSSGGRPGFVVDELASLRDDAQFVTGNGLLRSSPTSAVGRRLLSRARTLQSSLPPELAEDVELLATAGHVPGEHALAELGIDLPELRLRELVVVEEGRNGSVAALDPPVLQRAVRAALAPDRARSLADRVHAACGSRLPVYERVRVALTVGGATADSIGAAELRDAARSALSAHLPNEALALAARAAAHDTEGRLVEANLLADVGRRVEAAERYAALLDDPTADAISHAIAGSEYAVLLLWDLGRPDEAMDVAHRLAAAAAGTPFDAMGRVLLASTKLYGGRPVEALVALEGTDRNTLDETLRHTLDMVELTATALTKPGTIHGLGSVAALIGLQDSERPMLIRPAVGAIAATLALELSGNWADAEAVLDEFPPDRLTDRTTISLAWLALATARTKLAVGRLDDARIAAAESAAGFSDVNHASGVRWARATSMMAAGLSGDQRACRLELDAWQRLDPGAPFLDADLLRARAWAEWTVGNSALATALLGDAAEHAARTGSLALEAVALHDVFRMVRGSVRARLAELAERSPSPSITLRLRHVDGIARGDVAGLVALAEELERRGALLLAAEVAGDAVPLAEASGLRTASRTASAMRNRLAEVCQGAETPGVTGQRSTGLTPRERDVCVLAAEGRPSKEIAERLGVSVRTVDNLLQRSYVKLGVSGRNELAGRTF